MDRYNETIANIKQYLEEGSHNVVAMNQECSSNGGFLIESLLSTKRIIIKIQVDKNINTVIIDAFPMISIPEEHKANACQKLMEISSEFKAGTLQLDKFNNVYSHIETTFNDGAISSDTYETLELIAITMLIRNMDTIESLAKGDPLVSIKSKHPRRRPFEDHEKSLLKELMDIKDEPEEHEEDDDADDNIDNVSIDLSAVFAREEDVSDDEEEEE